MHPGSAVAGRSRGGAAEAAAAAAAAEYCGKRNVIVVRTGRGGRQRVRDLGRRGPAGPGGGELPQVAEREEAGGEVRGAREEGVQGGDGPFLGLALGGGGGGGRRRVAGCGRGGLG